MDRTAVLVALMVLLGDQFSQALEATACLNNHGRASVELRCPSPMTISLTKIEVGYALDSCVRNLSCPLEVLTDDNEYYQFLMTNCDRQQNCELSSRTLYNAHANQFSRCQHSGKVRNLVKVGYSCVRVTTTASTTTTSAINQGISLAAIVPWTTFPTMSPNRMFLPAEANLPESSTTTSPPPTTTTRKELTTTVGSVDLLLNIGDTTPETTEAPAPVTTTRTSIVTTTPATDGSIAITTATSIMETNSTTTENIITAETVVENTSWSSTTSEVYTTTADIEIGADLEGNADSLAKAEEDLYLDQTGTPTKTSQKWVTHILIPFLAGCVLVVIVLATVLALAKRRRKRKSTADQESPVHNEFTNTLSTTYDTISGISGFTGHYEDMYYSEPDIATNKSDYYSTTEYSSAEYSTPSDPEPEAMQISHNDQNYEAVSIISDFTASSMHDTVSYETPNDVYDECANDTDTETERPPDVYAEIKKTSTKNSDLLNACIDIDDEPAVLIVNDVYECTDLTTDDPSEETNGESNECANTVFIDNDLYNSWDS